MNENQPQITVFLTALLSSDELIQTLTGQPLLNKQEAVLEGYNLVVQRLDQVPDPAQKIIRGTWGDTFESYNLTPGDGRIKGFKCTITEDQMKRLAEWEFEEFGWFVPREVEITNPTTGEKEKVMTMVMGEGQEYDRVVDGENFEPFLMPKEKTLEVAAVARNLYDERMRIPQERHHPAEKK